MGVVAASLEIVDRLLTGENNLIFFDVGAGYEPDALYYEDTTGYFLQKFGDRIKKVYSFEPIHHSYLTEKYTNHDKVTVITKALAETSGKKTLYCPPSKGLVSLYNREVFGQLRDGGLKIKEIEIECTTVDEIVAKYNIPYIDYLKIDVEGAELDVLKGATKTLQEGRVIAGIFEFGGTFDDAKITVADVESFLDRFRYKFYCQVQSHVIFVKKDGLVEKTDNLSDEDFWNGVWDE
jgi:FkbM family methyltransferase